jgi:hypothetical protein
MGATIGAVRERCDDDGSEVKICFLIGIAVLEFIIFSPEGEGERAAGEAIECGTRKSSKFMGSPAIAEGESAKTEEMN